MLFLNFGDKVRAENPTYILEPEVPGGLGPRTQMDQSCHPPRITRLHFIFDGWLGDQIVESFPCYLATESLAEILGNESISGFELDDVEIETSEQFKERYPSRKLPPFKWLKVMGKPDESDIFMTPDHRLGVTRKALDCILATHPRNLDYCEAT